MGTYINFTAKSGLEDLVNNAFTNWYFRNGNAILADDRFLVYSEKVIESEIAYIHSPDGNAQSHLRGRLNSVVDWCNLFPSWGVGNGQLKISSGDEEDTPYLKAILLFLWQHRELFSEIRGLDDAERYELLPPLWNWMDVTEKRFARTFTGELELSNGQTYEEVRVAFDGRTGVYLACRLGSLWLVGEGNCDCFEMVTEPGQIDMRRLTSWRSFKDLRVFETAYACCFNGTEEAGIDLRAPRLYSKAWFDRILGVPGEVEGLSKACSGELVWDV